MRPARLAAAVLAFAGTVFAGAAQAQGPSMREMFQGIPVDRCKEIGGPPTYRDDGPRIDSLEAAQGGAGQIVLVRAGNLSADRAEEVHFLLKGQDLRAQAQKDGPSGFRARVPDFGVSGQPAKGWIYLSRGDVRGKPAPFLFLPAAAPGGSVLPTPATSPPVR
ncbi:MAG TPA: hypothetical protein VF853_08850 [Candidatus Deferrimicrobiaceae bacterium]